MDQHFVPQFYLRAWTDPDTPAGQEPWLWVADLEARTVRRKAPKNVAAEPGYYSVGEDDTAEQLHSAIESAAAPVVRKMLAGNLRWTEEERADLLVFAAFLATRVPGFRDPLQDAISEMGQQVLQLAASNAEHFQETARAAMPDEHLTDERLEAIRQSLLEPGQFVVQAQPSMSLGVGIHQARDTVFPILMDMNWAFLQASEEHFVTSDRPVTWHDPTPRPPFYAAGQGLLMRGIQVTFPLGPRLCLYGTWEGRTGAIGAGSRLARKVNRHRMAFASKSVFADSEVLAHGVLDQANGTSKSPEED